MSTSIIEMQDIPNFSKSSLFLRFNTFPQISSHTTNLQKKRSASYCDFSNEQVTAKKQCFDIEKFNDQQSVIANSDIDFIEISKFIESMSEAVIIDCRLLKDYFKKHIKNSLHINCLDNITRKRLLSNRLSVKDLLSCDKVKKRLENMINRKKNEEVIENELLIVIYDGSTNNQSELINQNNPLKLVLDNIKITLKNINCKILKGGFEEFSKNYKEYCEVKMNKFSLNPIIDTEEELKVKIENAEISKILDYLYLGNESDAKNEDLLLKEGITHIINVTKNIPFYHENSDTIKLEYLRVSVNDSCDQDIKKYFDEANNFIDKVNQQNGKVLVHCQAGISRSPTIVIAYLMNSKNLSLEECYDDVKKIRPIVEPNFLFYSQLHIYESCLNKSLNVQTL